MCIAAPTLKPRSLVELARLANDLSRIWIGNADFRDSLEAICRHAMRMSDADNVTAWLLEGRQLRPAATAGKEGPFEVHPDMESNHPGACAVRNRDAQILPPETILEDSVLAVPILVDGQALGALVFRRQGLSFQFQEISGAEALANQAGFAFRMLRRARELELVYEVTRAISSTLNLEEVIAAIHHGLSRILPTDNFYIALYDEAQGEIRFAVEIEEGRSKPPRKRAAAAGLTEFLLRTKRPLLIPSHFPEAANNWTSASRDGRHAAGWARPWSSGIARSA